MIKFDDCKSVINRIMQAYKIKKAKDLADKWEIAASVIGSRIQRNALPADFVLKCVMDTNANPIWLLTGYGDSGIDGVGTTIKQIELPDDIIEKLERLGNLRKDNVITDDEFNILKVNLIK